MFGKNKDDENAGAADAEGTQDDLSAPPLKPFSRKGSHAPTKPPAATTFHPEVPRRSPDIPGPAARRTERARGSDMDHRRLIVGRDIHLSGEINSCDKLIVEGRVEVSISNARVLEIAPTGFFNGHAEVEEADISGRFEGELVARDRLVVRSGGRIRGAVRYGRIVIESGGEISGDMQTLDTTDPGAGDEGTEDERADTTASADD